MVPAPASRCITSCLIACLLGSMPAWGHRPAPVEKDEKALLAEAFGFLSAGALPEARLAFESLIHSHPACFKAYPLYWRTLEKLEEVAGRKRAVEAALPFLESVPVEERDQSYYLAFLEGCRILNDEDRARPIRKEAIEHDPNGWIAQSTLLDEAKAAADREPRKSVSLYHDYLSRFPDRVSWNAAASKWLLEVMAAHPADFSGDELTAAAVQADRNQRRQVDASGGPDEYVQLMKRISGLFLAKDPAAALEYAMKGLAFVQEQWPRYGRELEDSRKVLWPSLLRIHVVREDWKSALSVGKALVEDIDGTVLELTPAEETSVRTDYAEALEHTDSRDAALEQRAVAADPARIRPVKEANRRRRLLATEQKRPAADFHLEDLSGKPVRLEDYRGKTLVMSMWATWCSPCVEEMGALQKLRDRYRSDSRIAFLAVSVDEVHTPVKPMVEKQGWDFTVALPKGSLEAPYRTNAVPRLFVIDRKGMLRFESMGYDENFVQNLTWMIEAAER